jgi:hypothetical protein
VDHVTNRERLEMIRADCKADAARPLIDHLNDPTPTELRLAVSTRHGEMLAMIDALAATMLSMLDEVPA